ncbi:type 1 pili tip component [Woeseia oceani]|uniref:Type 1 pili tip component n=1 Tax=Woeseia oceani TaxID=1548547 RepID=A0A193LK34_9GAMM|nr:type 1 pili tip component [Woeseia oceani]ANO52793.1 type 1 pili tip component [Woeseia oceani]
MRFKALLKTWSKQHAQEHTEERYSIQLNVDDAARLAALAELFPGNSPEQLISDLLSAALDETETAMPYVAGATVIREDEFGDPVYEDVGLTPRFLELVRQHRAKPSGNSGNA